MHACGSNFRPAATDLCQLHPLENGPIARCAALPAHSGALVFLHKLARLQKAGDKILGNGLALLLAHDQFEVITATTMHPVLSKLLKTKAVHTENCELSQGHLPILPIRRTNVLNHFHAWRRMLVRTRCAANAGGGLLAKCNRNARYQIHACSIGRRTPRVSENALWVFTGCPAPILYCKSQDIMHAARLAARTEPQKKQTPCAQSLINSNTQAPFRIRAPFGAL